MPVIPLVKFAGVAPRSAPYALPPELGQDARNCAPYNSLKPLRQNATVMALGSPGESTIYRFGGTEGNDSQFWFHWPGALVDVVKGAISGDTAERTYFVKDGQAYATDVAKALTGGSGDYPWGAWKLGVPAPQSSLAVTVDGIGDPDYLDDRIYIHTFVTAWGEESAPSNPSTVVSVALGQNVTLTGFDAPQAGYENIVERRIYRSTAGGIYQFVDQIQVGTTSYLDGVATESLAEPCPSIYWEAPPAMDGMIGMANGIIVGYKDYDIFPCEAYRPFAWPSGYRLALDYKIVGGASFGTTAVICTQGSPYILQGADPSSMSLQKIEFPQSCVSKRSITPVLGGVVYASPDGLVYVSPNEAPRNLTAELFSRDDWQSLLPASIKGFNHEDRYVGFFDTGLAKGGFVFNIVTGSFIWLDWYATAGFNDRLNDQLYLKVGTDLVKFAADPLYHTYSWKSKLFLQPRHTNFAAGQVIAAAYPVTFKLYYDGLLFHTQLVENDLPFRLPSGRRARNVEIELSGNKEIVAAYVATSIAELKEI